MVIFITAYDQYAVRAFPFSSVDYLLKPVDTIDLVAAVQKAEQQAGIHPTQLDILRHYHPSCKSNSVQPASYAQFSARISPQLIERCRFILIKCLPNFKS
jgi:DNA-binding LytR/AlgR family response regulator